MLGIVFFLAGGCARLGNPGETTGSLPSGAVAAQQDGVELQVAVTPAAVAPGEQTTITVVFTNRREEPLMYDSGGCFAHIEITAALPLDPVGRTWTGNAAWFKAFALADGYGPGGVPATAPIVLRPIPEACDTGTGYQSPLDPGAVLSATLQWPTEYVAGVAVLPQDLPVNVSVGYDLQNGPPSYPPDYTGIRGSWIAEFNRIQIDTTVTVTGDAPKVITAGEAIDAALGDPAFRELVDERSDGHCLVNLFLFDMPPGGYLPAGSAWEVDNICERPRQFVIVMVDPLGGDVTGRTTCPVPCDR